MKTIQHQPRMRFKATVWLLMLTFTLSALGCQSKQLKNDQLKQVAKEWCMTIRASQVVPVYPLTEDLQPGDIFLVQLSVDTQHQIYEDKGFLPFDNHLARLNPLGYESFYRNSFDHGGLDKQLPKEWLKTGDDNNAWKVAPKAAFPTYRFSVRSGSGFNLALPVSGVPVGLSLMGSDAADGTITIAEASTYGIDILSIDPQVRQWAQENRKFLANFQPPADSTKVSNFVRIITRIYLTGELDVSMRDRQAMAAGLDAGAAKPINIAVMNTDADPTKVSAEAYKKNIENLNKMLSDSLKIQDDNVLPGGSLRVTSASAGSISLKQKFARPLVIGYIGYDVPILQGGILGAPIPTHALLDRQIETIDLSMFDAKVAYEELRWSQAALSDIYRAVKLRTDSKSQQLISQLDAKSARMPQVYGVTIYKPDMVNSKPALQTFENRGRTIRSRSDFQHMLIYWGKLSTSKKALDEALTNTDMTELDGKNVDNANLKQYLATTEQLIQQIRSIIFEDDTVILTIKNWQAKE